MKERNENNQKSLILLFFLEKNPDNELIFCSTWPYSEPVLKPAENEALSITGYLRETTNVGIVFDCRLRLCTIIEVNGASVGLLNKHGNVSGKTVKKNDLKT